MGNRRSEIETKPNSTIRPRRVQEPPEGHWCKRIRLTLIAPMRKKFHFLAFNKAITQVSIKVRNLSSNVYKRRHKKQIACSDYFSFVPRIAFCHKTYTHDDDVYHLMRPCFHLPVTRKSNTPLFSLDRTEHNEAQMLEKITHRLLRLKRCLTAAPILSDSAAICLGDV